MIRIDAVAFDLFDTLIHFRSEDYRSAQNAMADHLNVPLSALLAAYRDTSGAAMSGELTTITARLARILDQLECPVDALDPAVQMEQHALKTSTTVIDGVEDMLLKLQFAGRVMAVISNSSAAGAAICDSSRLTRFFDELVFSFEVQLKKPDPAMYLLACDRLKIAPENTAFVSDGNRGELVGAARAGLLPIRFDPTGQYQHLPVPPGTPEFSDASELASWILRHS